MEPLLLGLIGSGQQGRAHAEALAQVEELSLSAVADVNLDSARTLASSLDVEAYADYHDLLARTDISAVLIVAPSYLHTTMVLDALQAGKHVLVEKPLAYTTAECDRMIMEAEARHLKLTVGHQMRLWPIYERVRELIREYGPVTTVQCTRYSDNRGRAYPAWYGNPSIAKGMLFEVSVHEIDFMCSIAGDVVSVQALVENYADDKHPLAETCLVLLRFANGATGQLADSGTSSIQRWAGLVTCTQGAIEFDYLSGIIRVSSGHGTPNEEHPDRLAWNSLAREQRSFARWILYNEPPVVTARDGRRACAIAEAAYLAAERGSAVMIPPQPPEPGSGTTG